MTRKKAKFQHYENKPDYIVLLSTAILVIFGLIVLSSASSDLGKIKFGNSYYYLKHQIFNGLILGTIGFIFCSKFYYQHYKKISVIILAAAVFGLILIFTPLGISAGGAVRWLKIGPLTFQPSEIMKLAFIIYIAAWLSGNKQRTTLWKGFLPFLFICGIIVFLLIKQPSTSVAGVLILSALAIYFASGARISYIIGTIFLGIVFIAAISYLTPYRWQRITSFLNPNSDILSSGYHINQALIAIGSGGLTGVGFGQSTTKIHYLPEPVGDSIFAVIAEEFGFIGSVLLIIVYLILIIRGFILARKTGDKFGQLLLVGFSSLIGFQTFAHIGAISGLIPLTGIPLPFISYGGTALAVFMTISGIMVNISRHIRNER